MHPTRAPKHHLPESIVRTVLGHGGLVLVAIGLVTGMAIYEIANASFGSSMLEVFLDNRGEYDESVRVTQVLGGNSDDYVYLGARAGPDLFTDKVLTSLRELANDLEKLPEVVEATSFVDMPTVSGRERLGIGELSARSAARTLVLAGKVPQGVVRLRPYWPISRSQQLQIDMKELQEELLKDERVRGTLLSADGNCWGMVLKLAPNQKLPILRQIQLRWEILKVARGIMPSNNEIHLSGLLISQSWLFEEMFTGLTVICPLVLFSIATTVWVIFRSWGTIAIAMLIAILSTVWAIGMTVFCFGEITLLVLAAAPPVIITISTSDFIHLTSTFRTELETGCSRYEALAKTLREVGGACVLTSLTTLIGFASLASVPVPATRHFAFAAAAGVASAFFLQSLGPIIYLRSRIGVVPLSDRLQTTTTHFFDDLVTACRYVSGRFPLAIIGASLVVIAFSLISVFRVDFSADFPMRFPRHHPLRTSSEFFSRELSGSAHVELLLRLNGLKATDPVMLKALSKITEDLRTLPNVQVIHSLLTPLRSLETLLHIDDVEGFRSNPLAVESGLQLMEQTNQDAIRGFVSADRDLVRVYAQVGSTDFIDVARLGKQIEAQAHRSIADENRIEPQVTGTMYLVGRSVERIIQSQWRGNWICIIVITLIMAIALGSLWNSLMAQLPNLVPLAILFGVIVWSFDRMDTDLLGLPMIALGIAVDDTIHFLHRYRLQLESGQSRQEALESTFRFTGRAIVQSALILCVGLCPCALSSYLGVRMIGTLLVFTLACGLIADLLLVPALIKLGIIR